MTSPSVLCAAQSPAVTEAVATGDEPVWRHLCDEVNRGLPPLPDDLGPPSPFEFWPAWVFYTPVVVQSLILGVRHGNWALPLVVNPGIELSGMVGESKHRVLQLAKDEAKRWIAPYVLIHRGEQPAAALAEESIARLRDAGLSLPLVAKPDIGCRGAGVQLIESEQQLRDYVNAFPRGQQFLLQAKAPFEAEAGIFYVRYPRETKGRIISLALKYKPFVTGDGVSTLEQLIRADRRAGALAHLYLSRHREVLHQVVPAGRKYRLSFSGSHCRGSIFRNGNRYISDRLSRRLDRIFDALPGMYYGRLDIKFKDMASLQAGEDFTILEINGASSEAAHIWDRDTPLAEIFSTLLRQYRILYKLGTAQRKLGYKVPAVADLLRAWRRERRLVRAYPATD